MYKDTHQYDDIINLSRPVSKKHLPMPLIDRAAQFSPFAALTGFDEEIDETARLTDVERELTEDELNILNGTFQRLLELAPKRPLVSVKYFIPDNYKEGGRYETFTGKFRFFDEEGRKLKFTDGTEIMMKYICNINIKRNNDL